MSQFPQFTKLTLTDKETIERIVSRFDSYSDFNFTSLFCWNVDNSAEFSIVDDNVVIKIPDYLTGEPVFSLLGDSVTDDVLQRVLAVAGSLSFVPDPVIAGLTDVTKFAINEDRNHFDYVYKLSDLVETPGGKYKNIRNKLHQFTKAYPSYTFTVFDTISDQQRTQLPQIFREWAQERELPEADVRMEQEVVERFINHMSPRNLVGVVMSIDNKPVGFSINEIIDDNYALCHLQKSIHTYKNSDTALTHHVSQVLLDKGCMYVNWEQDLGIKGLRQLKEAYRPTLFLKKYAVTLAQ